ncbi:MAG: GNAT family N-acetyltransferase [bacterium]
MEIRRVRAQDYSALKIMAIGILEPLYSDQSKALNEWFTGAGHKLAFVLASEKEIGGFLSVKANPAKSYLKISTLLVFNGHKRLGYGKRLLTKAFKLAKEFGYSKLKVTVSDAQQESLVFFSNAGFYIVDKQVGKYTPDSTEIILEMEVQ